MALATKFRVQGTSDVFGQITVNIQLNDYAGPIIDLDAVGRDWIRLKIGDNSSEMSSPILAGKLTFSFYVTEDFETVEIGKSDVYTYYVEVLDENLDQIWAGWAMPEEYTEAYHNTPYVATVVASDGLQELKNVNYPLQDGKATLFTHLQNCLISTFVNNNIFESVNIYSNGMNSTASDSPFKQAQVTYNSFRSISETPKAYEVLSSLLVPFFARIYQYRGWRIEAILEKRSSYVVREYDITGAFVGQSTFNPLVKFDTDYGTFRAFIQKSGQLSIRPALNNAEVYFNTIEPVEPTTTGGFQDADDWVSTTELDKWTVVAGGGANQISIEQVPSSFDGNEFAVKIPGRKTSLELTDYIESDPVNIATADYESINVDFAYYANYPAIVLLGSKPILYFEIVFTETSSGDVYNWSGSEWVLIPLGQPRKRLRIDFNDRMKWRRYSAVIDRVPSTGNIKFRFYKLVKSGTEGVTELRLTAWKTNLVVSQPTNAALLLEAGTTNVFTQYKGPSFPHIISDGTVLNAAGVMDVANTLTATWARRGVAESLNIRRLFLTQWLSFNSRPTEILSGVIHQKGEVITPMSVVKDKDAVASTRYVMQSYEMSLGTGIGSASYREIVMEDANINAFQEFLDSIRLGDFFATTVNYNIFIGGAPGLSPGANPGQIDLNFNLNGDVRGGLNQAEITPAAIQNKARLDLTGLTAEDILINAVRDSLDQENMTNLRLSDIKPLVSVGAGAGLSIDGAGNIQLGNDGAGVVDISDDVFGGGLFINGSGGDGLTDFGKTFSVDLVAVDYNTFISASASDLVTSSTIRKASIQIGVSDGLGNIELEIEHTDDPLEGSYAIFRDQINSKGLEYADDYSANWTDHSLVTKSWVTGQISGSAHNPVTIGSPANGLSIDASQVLTIGLASTSATGALSSTDWNTFNNKLNLTSLLTGYTVGANTALAATDTILQAFGKVQGQINAKIGGSIASGQVAFGTGVNTVGGGSGLLWNNSTKLFTAIGSQIFQGTTASDTAPLGTEIATTGSGTNWTGTGFATGYTHVVGSTAPLTTSIPAVNATYYQIAYTVTGRTAGSFTINFGGTTTTGLTATGATGPLATSTANLEIVPTTDFDGTIVLSVRSIGTSSATTTFRDSGGTARIEIRATTAASNTLIGIASGRRITTGINNSFFGLQAGLNNTTGTNNSFFGVNAGISNTTGGNNSFFGVSSGLNNTTGTSNSFFGVNAGISNTTGGNNSFFGRDSGFNNTTGGNNSFFGRDSGFNNTTGGSNSFFGVNAGRFIASGTNLTIANNSIFVGNDTRANADNETNQIVIGHNAIGGGSNTVVIGNSSIVSNRFFGTMRIGTIFNLGTAATSVLVPSATGVVSLRTLAELAGDAGIVADSVQTVTTSGTINDLSTTSNTIVFTGASVTLNGIVALADGRRLNLINRTGSNLTISTEATGSTAANRFSGGISIPNNSSVIIVYSNSLARWIHFSSGAFVSNSYAGTRVFGNFTAGDSSATPNANIATLIRSNANTDGSFAFATERLDGTRTFEIRSLSSFCYTPMGIGLSPSIGSGRTLVLRSLSGTGWPFEIFDNAGTSRILVFNNGNIGSTSGMILGAASSFTSPTARLDVRGLGTSTGLTMLLEDSAGTNNVEFVDNGQIRFLRLPTSSAGLPAGSLWNNGGVLNIV